MTLIPSLIIVSLWLVGVLAVSRKTANENQATEISRKVVHIGCGITVPIAWSLGIPATLALVACIVMSVLVILNYKLNWLSSIERHDKQSFGTIFYCLSITVLTGLFWREQPFALQAGVLVMAIADGLASLIGMHVTSPQWTLQGQTKSLAGTVAMAAASVCVLLTLALISGEMPALTCLWIGVTVTALEQWSIRGIDNLTVPIATALIWIQTATPM